MVNQTLKEIDSRQLYYSIIAGAQRIFEHQKMLNQINVFPVADADTGTNLASTMRSIVDAKIPMVNLKQTAVAIADAAMNGARGNSGIIFAQFLYGFSNEIQTDQPLTIQSFAESMKRAVAYAYDAIANPVEGTILTVIKDWADYIYTLKDIMDDFIKLFLEAYKKAVESLADTTNKLEILARAHVVDAGAKGFVYFLEGFLDFFTKGIKAMAPVANAEEEEGPYPLDDLHEVINFRYCTEALIAGDHINLRRLREVIKNCGDSMVVAGSPQKVRVHIHTDFPAEVFSLLHDFGDITYQKVDDMIMQNEILHRRRSDIAIVTDSTCDIPKELIDKYQIHVLPLSLHLEESFYLDRVTINPEQFYYLMNKSDKRATTSQPTGKDFVNKYEYLTTQYQSVIAIHISHALSGTFQNSEKSAQEVMQRTSKRLYVFNSKKLSGALGLIVLRLAHEIEKGTKIDELIPKIDEWIGKTIIRVSVPTLKYIIRSGRVSPFKSFIARMFDLKPVICVDDEGKSVLFEKSFTEKANMHKVMKGIRKVLQDHEIWEYAVTHAGAPENARWFVNEMKRLTGKDPLFLEHVSPALVANTGPGVIGVSLMLN